MPRKKCEIFLNFSLLSPYTTRKRTIQAPLQARMAPSCVYLLYSSFLILFSAKKWKIFFCFFIQQRKREKEAKKICVKFDIEKNCMWWRVKLNSCDNSLSLSTQPPQRSLWKISALKREWNKFRLKIRVLNSTNTPTWFQKPDVQSGIFSGVRCKGC